MQIRELTLEDKPLLQKWIDAESDHKASSPEFYFQPNTKAVVYLDDAGPVLAAKFTPIVRLDLEFSPLAGKLRIAKTMLKEVPALIEQAKNQGFHEFVFSSSSPELIKFCTKIGFCEVSDYRKIF